MGILFKITLIFFMLLHFTVLFIFYMDHRIIELKGLERKVDILRNIMEIESLLRTNLEFKLIDQDDEYSKITLVECDQPIKGVSCLDEY